MLRNDRPGAQRFGHQSQGFSGVGRDNHGGDQLPGADPRLARSGHAIATHDGNREPLFALRIGDGFLDGLARADAHGVILRDDQVDTQPLGRD